MDILACLFKILFYLSTSKCQTADDQANIYAHFTITQKVVNSKHFP